MSLGLGDLYKDAAPTPGQVLPKHAVAAVTEADRLAGAIHHDVTASRVRPQFRAAWHKFYNSWLAYRTLHSSQQVQTNPDAVVSMEVPQYVTTMLRWRDALAAERGGVIQASATRTPSSIAGTAPAGFPWKMVLAIVGLGGAAWGAKLWWAAHERAKVQEEADKQAARMQLAQAVSMTSAPPSLFLPPGAVQVPPPPAWPVQAVPMQYAPPAPPPAPTIPPGYVLVRAS